MLAKKAIQTASKADIRESEKLREQAIHYLRQAIKIIRIHFSEVSLHIKRIQEKIKCIEQG